MWLAILLVLVGCGRIGFEERSLAGVDAAPVCAADVDFTSDPANCGSCGHSCLGAQCSDSMCHSVMLATGQGSLRQILEQGEYLYYAANGAIRRIPKAGGMPEVVATFSGTAFRMTAHGGYLYWVTRNTGIVARAPIGVGTTTEVIATGQGDVGGIATDGVTVYWNNYPTGGKIVRKQINSTMQFDVLPPTDNLTGMRLVGDTLYYLRADSNAGLFAIDPTGGSPPTTIAPGVGSWEMAIDGDDVFLASAAKDKILRVSRSTGGISELAPAIGPWGIVVDATHVYFANEFGDTIQRVPRGGGAVETLAGTVTPVGIVVDDTAVYWTTIGGTIGKVAK